MEPTDLTIEILKEIRNEIRHTNERLDATNERLDTTNERLERLERRQMESEVRLATELVAVAGAVRDVKTLLAERLDVRDRVVKCEAEILTIKRHVGLG